MNASVLEKLNGDLYQQSKIRYTSYPLVLDAFISLAYWNGLILVSFSLLWTEETRIRIRKKQEEVRVLMC